MSEKSTNPKDLLGIKKVPLHCIPCGPLLELGLGMMEGGRKYGAHNYREMGVAASVYYDAAMRHLIAWWEGEDIDPDSGQHHVVKCMTALLVLRDSMLMGNHTDDRPVRYPNGLNISEFNKQAAEMIKKYPTCVDPYLEKDRPGNRPLLTEEDNQAIADAMPPLAGAEATIEHVHQCGWQIRLANGMFLWVDETSFTLDKAYSESTAPYYHHTKEAAELYLAGYLEITK